MSSIPHKKSSRSLALNGASVSMNSKAVESFRRSQVKSSHSIKAPSNSNSSSGINSPTVLSTRSEKSTNSLENVPVNPYMVPKPELGNIMKEGVSTTDSIDEYWLGFPHHSKPVKESDLKLAANFQPNSTLRSNSPSSLAVPSFKRTRDCLQADSLNEFIELENTLQKEIVEKHVGNQSTIQKNKGTKIFTKEDAAKIIQRWYRRKSWQKRQAKSSLHQMMKEKHRQYSSSLAAERENPKKLLSPADKKTRSNFSDQGRALRQKAIEELRSLRQQRRLDIERKAKEELASMEASKKTKPNKNKSALNDKNLRASSARVLSSKTTEELNDGLTAGHADVEEIVDVDAEKPDSHSIFSSSISIARTKTTLDDLLSTLQNLEKDCVITSRNDDEDEEVKLPPNKTLAWLEEIDKTTTDNVSNLPPKPTDTGSKTVPVDNGGGKQYVEYPSKEDVNSWLPPAMSQRAESVAFYLEGVQTSARRIDDIDQTMVKQEEEIKLALKNINSAAKIADLQQLERASAEITSKCLQQQAELEAKQHTIKMLQKALNQQREYASRQTKDFERESKKQLDAQRNEYETAIQRHLSFIDQLIEDKKALTEKCEKLVTETRDLERKSSSKLKDLEEQHAVELKKIREFEQAAEKLRREKWIAEREKRIKEATVKGLEPEIQRLIAQHKDEFRKLKSQHEADMLASDERAAQKYVKLVEELRQQLNDEKEEACRRERELAKQRYESALTQERMQLQQTEKRLYNDVASERDRIADQSQRQRSELESLQRQLEETHRSALELMRQEYDRAKKDQEEKHAKELKDFEERVKIEKQMWEEQYMKKQETWLMTKERELKEKVRTERDREIESVISQLEGDTRRQREEVERSAENRVKRLRDKYDSEISELERSERQTMSKYNETKARQAETQGELEHTRAVLRQKEAELNDLTSDLQKLRDERGRVADIVRQELADRLVAVEEENGRMKAELAEQKARSKAEAERLREEISTAQRSKEVELDEIHQRVKQAIAKKEEVVTQLRQQYEAATRRADHLEGLLEQQRKQIIGASAVSGSTMGPAASARSGVSVAHSIGHKK